MSIRCTFLLTLIVALAAASPAGAVIFPWPDSNQRPRVILSADQSIEDYLNINPERFAADFLVAGLYIKDIPLGESDEAVKKFGDLYNILQSKGIVVGTYISGTTAIHDLQITKFPENAASIEDMSVKTRYLGSWSKAPEEQVVDLSDTLSRQQLESAIRALWLLTPAFMRFVDNAAVHPDVARMQSWVAYCQNITALRNMAEGMQDNAIFNVFVRPWQFSDEEMQQLINAVAGNGGNAVSLPMPWSKSIRDNKNANAWAIYRYRQLLDHHIAVILVPSEDAPQKDLMSWVSTWRRPADRLYIATPYWEP